MNDTVATNDATNTDNSTAVENPLERHITYSFGAAEVDAEVEKKLSQMRKKARINGFRPGHVPLSHMRDRWGAQCREEILTDKAGSRFQEEAAKWEERVASRPAVTPATVAVADKYNVDCHYEAFPTIEAPTLDGRELRQGVLEIGEPEINQMIERLRRDAGHYHVVERAAQKNDQLQVNLQVWHDDELVGENAKRQWILGSPMLHGEITTTLSGIVKGETRDIRIKHDDNHPNEKMRGIEERLTVTVEEISELHMPEQNEEFFSRFGVTEGGEEAFRQLVDTRLHSEVKQRLNDYGREQTMNLLIQATPKFALPQSLVRAEMSNMYQQLQQNVKKQNLPIPPDALQNIYMQATRRVTLGLIMAEWQRRENQQVTEEEVNAILEEMADTYEDSQTFKTHAQQNARFMEGLRLSALEKKAVQWIQDRVTVVEEPLTLGQLLGDVEEESPDDEKVSSTAEA